MVTSLFNQYYGGDINKIRQQYEQNLARPSELNIQQSEVDTGEITNLLDQIIQRYKIGGEFGKAELALLNRAKKKSLASTMQGMVSAGLAGTTVPSGAGKKWEEEIGMPSRLRLEDIRTERLTGAMGAKAGFMERAAAREEQFNLQKEQLLLQERLQNREISLQEYLSEMDRLSKRSYSVTVGSGGGGAANLPEGFGEFSSNMKSAGDLQSESLARKRSAGQAGPGPSYVNVGTPGFPSWVQGSMTANIYQEPGIADPSTPPNRQGSLADMAQKWLSEPSTGTFSGF